MKPNPMLLPAAWVYGLVQRWDRRRKEAERYVSGLPVISVGNISAGGSGKTPMVARLIELLSPRWPVLLLTRGYGREINTPLVWRAGTPVPGVERLGDEPAMLARGMTRGAIGVAADRAALLRSIEAEFAGHVVLLDDGFQHYRLGRDLDIVIVDDHTVERPWLIPAGLLREPPAALARAGVVVAASDDAAGFARRFMAPETPLFRSTVNVEWPTLWSDPATRFIGRRPVVAAGIAHPERLTRALMALGIEPVGTVLFQDHQRYTTRSLARLMVAVRRGAADSVITTAKDAVKLGAFDALRPLLHVAEAHLHLSDEPRLLAILSDVIERKL